MCKSKITKESCMFFEKHGKQWLKQHGYVDFSQWSSVRDQYVRKFGWSVINESTLSILKYMWLSLCGVERKSKHNIFNTLTPTSTFIVKSIGAGRGYWEYCMQRAGIDVVASDINPGDSYNDINDGFTWTHVSKMDGLESISSDETQTILMLNWSSMESWVDDVINKYYDNGGRTIIWIGEVNGCNGTDNTQHYLNRKPRLLQVSIPQFKDIHDTIIMYSVYLSVTCDYVDTSDKL